MKLDVDNMNDLLVKIVELQRDIDEICKYKEEK